MKQNDKIMESLLRWQSGDESAWSELQDYVSTAIIQSSYGLYVPGYEEEDVINEVLTHMIPILRTVQVDAKKGSLKSIIKAISRRKIMTIVKGEGCDKRKSINVAQSIYQPFDNDDKSCIADFLAYKEKPEVKRLDAQLIEALKLSETEMCVLRHWINDGDEIRYQDIAEELGCTKKSIDNSIQRIKRKARQILAQQGNENERTHDNNQQKQKE